jgi:hypothetical protein
VTPAQAKAARKELRRQIERDHRVHQVIPLDPKIRTILDVVVILVLLWWVARAFGLVAMLDRPVRTLR